MIFVTIGSAPQDFSRLIKKIDELAAGVKEEFVVQLGFTRYKPARAKWFDFVAYEEARRYFSDAKVIVGHASAGPLMHAREFRKPLVIFPRNGTLHEHIDNHQMETAAAIEGISEFIEVVYDEEKLLPAIERALKKTELCLQKPYVASGSVDSLVASIRSFVETLNKP